MIRHIVFDDDRLTLLDQRLLPAEERYLTYTDAAGVAGAICQMVVRGAPAIGIVAAYGAALEARRLAAQGLSGESFARRLDQALQELAATRPTAVNLFWALQSVRERLVELQGEAPAVVAQQLAQLARDIHQDDIARNRAMGEHGAALIPDGAHVLTHCNTGHLATGGFGTALGVVRAAVAQGKRIHVWVDETRPRLQGARLTAWECLQDGIPATLVTDSMAGHLMQQGKVNLVIVGADRVAANGDLANKIGTYGLAVLAQHHALPFYGAMPWSTVDLATPSGRQITIEERHADEVLAIGQERLAPTGMPVYNPAFDVTPNSLITALITERGVVRPPYGVRLKALGA